MSFKMEPAEDRLADFTRDWRLLILSAMAIVIGATSAAVAYALVWLIGVITNLAFYQTCMMESMFRWLLALGA